MADPYRIGKDGVKVTFLSSGYTFKDVYGGRVVAFPSSGNTFEGDQSERIIVKK